MNNPRRILVVEDNEDDVFFMRRALNAAAPAASCDFVADGQAALDYLRARGSFAHRAGAPPPDVVFLDLKLPYVYGLDVLAAVRASPALAALPVVVLTSSSEDRDRVAAAALGIEGYLVKPPNSRMVAIALDRLGTRPATRPVNPAATELSVPRPTSTV